MLRISELTNTLVVNNLVTDLLPISQFVSGTDYLTKNITVDDFEQSLTIYQPVHDYYSTRWNPVYTTVNTYSAQWGSLYTVVNSNSAAWNSNYDSVNTLSSKWESVYDTVNTLSSRWQVVYTTVNSASASWNSNYNTVNTLSSKWESNYSTVNANSANWTGVYTTVGANSATWNVTQEIGSILAWPASSLPAGFLECNGAAISKSTYAALYAILGDVYGSALLTFNLPDYRGYFLRGQDGGRGIDPDAAARTNRGDGTGGDNVGSKQDDAFESHTHAFTNQPVYVGTLFTNKFGDNEYSLDPVAATNATGGNETRPTNIYVKYIIKY